MVESAHFSRSDNDPTFSAQIGDELHTYTSDKEGKRQAILDGLTALETVDAGDDVYLPADAALQLVANILYPDGIQTEEQYETVCRTTDKACAFAGWGSEEQLGPPVVPFSKRGAYRKREPAVDRAVVLETLEDAGISSYAPQQQVNCRIVWNKLAWEVYGKPLNNLTGPQLERLQLQADAVTEAAGWRIESEGSSASYVRPLAPNFERARRLRRAFYGDDLDPALGALVRQVQAEQGYAPEPAGREYRPRPLTVPDDAGARLDAALTTLEPVQSELGQVLLWEQVLETARQALDIEVIGEWQAE